MTIESVPTIASSPIVIPPVFLVPVLGRPQNVSPLLDSIEATTPNAQVLFLADSHDTVELEAIEREAIRGDLCVKVDTGGGNYAKKINRGVRLTDAPLIFTGADDLRFCPDWLEAAKGWMVDGVEAVGVNDLIDRRSARAEHATHFLVSRAYADRGTIDGKPGLFFEGYDHSWVDNEFIETAKSRHAYVYAPDAHVEHLHPMNGKSDDDEVYRKGRQRFAEDQKTYKRRQSLWA